MRIEFDRLQHKNIFIWKNSLFVEDVIKNKRNSFSTNDIKVVDSKITR